MFASLSTHSPPLDYFPASQRVTYLYYLGRYLFANDLFYPALIALQESYAQCYAQALSQRRSILTYFIPCNMIMGRFPSQELLQRPECQGLLAEQFVPICHLIARGDYIAFREYLAVDSPKTAWLARKGILLALRNRCEILVWRSLIRRVFIYGGFEGDPQAQRPPYLYITKVEAIIRWLQRRHGQNGDDSRVLVMPDSRDFAVTGDDENDEEAGCRDFLAPDEYFDEHGQLTSNPSHNRVDGHNDTDYADYELNPYAHGSHHPDAESSECLQEIESILASLLTQGLMRGYQTLKNPRFAIPGARHRGALATGFPNVWQTISARERENSHVPGWVRPKSGMEPGGGSSRVVNLKGARPVGVQ